MADCDSPDPNLEAQDIRPNEPPAQGSRPGFLLRKAFVNRFSNSARLGELCKVVTGSRFGQWISNRLPSAEAERQLADTWIVALIASYAAITGGLVALVSPSVTRRLALLGVYLVLFAILYFNRLKYRTYYLPAVTWWVLAVIVAGVISFVVGPPPASYFLIEATDASQPIFEIASDTTGLLFLDQSREGKVGLASYGAPKQPGCDGVQERILFADEPEEPVSALDSTLNLIHPRGLGSVTAGLETARTALEGSRGTKVVFVVFRRLSGECDDPAGSQRQRVRQLIASWRATEIDIRLTSIGALTGPECALIRRFVAGFGERARHVNVESSDPETIARAVRDLDTYGTTYFNTLAEDSRSIASSCE